MTGNIDDMVIPNVICYVLLPNGTFSEKFEFISQLEVCQEGGGVKKGGTWRTLRVPDQRHG